MGFIKRNIFWIICGLLLIVAVGLFVYGSSVKAANRQAVAAIAAKSNSVPGLRTNAQRANVAIISRLSENAERARNDAATVVEKALQSSQRPFFYERVDRVFPRLINEQLARFYYGEFGASYVAVIDQMVERLNAQDRPSEMEERAAVLRAQGREDEARATTRRGAQAAPGGMMPGMGGMPGMDPGMMPGMAPDMGMGLPQTRGTGRDAASQEARIVEQMRRDRAENITIYAGPHVFAGYDFWQNPAISFDDTMLMHSWFSQLAVWVQEDVVGAVAAMNAGSRRVADSPVRRLIEISFSGDAVQPATGAMPGGAAGRGGRTTTTTRQDTIASRRDDAGRYRLPTYVLKLDEQFLGDVTAAFTKRASNDVYDVVQFETRVVIETSAVHDFLNALQDIRTTNTLPDGTAEGEPRSQITVLQTQQHPLNITMENAAGYYYGAGSLCVLHLVGEYVFFKGDELLYEAYKPAPVQELFEEQN